MKRITKTFALKAISEAVRKRGAGFVYDPYTDGHAGRCVYINPDLTPSCLVGEVLVAAGVDAAKLVDSVDNRFGVNLLAIEAERYGVTIDSAAAEVLRAAQIEQDCSQPWGNARRAANQKARSLRKARA